jgi:hypothetical protein
MDYSAVLLEVFEQVSNPDDRPWLIYRKEPRYKLLIPGYGGNIDDEEAAFIVKHLTNDTALKLWWGMPPRWRKVPQEVVKRLAMEGSADSLEQNRKLARPGRKPRDSA